MTSFKSNTLKLTQAALFTALGVFLPQLSHLFGADFGKLISPMHFPIFIAAFLLGPLYGSAVAIACPILNCLVTGMPVAAKLPFMVLELLTYALITGFTYKLMGKFKRPIKLYVSLILGQIIGRIVYYLGIVVAIKLFGVTHPAVFRSVSVLAFLESFAEGLPSIIIQLCLIPLIVVLLENIQRKHRS